MTHVKAIFKNAILILIMHSLLNGCSSGDEPKPFDCSKSDLQVSLVSSTNPSTCGSNNGSIVVNATGGVTPYTFSIDGTNFQSSATFNNLGGGSFTLRVKDKNGCVVSLSPAVVLDTPDGPQAAGSPTVESDTECNSNNGSITVTGITGGTGPYQYSRDGVNFQASNQFTGLQNGSYTITVKDATNCQITITNVIVPNGTGISYDGTILPIFNAVCNNVGCHPTNGNWFNYDVAKANAGTIKTRILLPDGNPSKMPASGSLSAQQIEQIVCWVDNGAPKN